MLERLTTRWIPVRGRKHLERKSRTVIALEVIANAIFKAFKEISCGKEIQKEYILSCHMKERFVTLLRNMALRPLSEAFKLVIKADIEISHDKGFKEEDIHNTRASPP